MMTSTLCSYMMPPPKQYRDLKLTFVLEPFGDFDNDECVFLPLDDEARHCIRTLLFNEPIYALWGTFAPFSWSAKSFANGTDVISGGELWEMSRDFMGQSGFTVVDLTTEEGVVSKVEVRGGFLGLSSFDSQHERIEAIQRQKERSD